MISKDDRLILCEERVKIPILFHRGDDLHHVRVIVDRFDLIDFGEQ